jgi:hypothetical protein
MKTRILIPLILCATLGVALSKTIKCPDDENVQFTINIPDTWKPEHADDGTLEAMSPNEHIYLATWELKDKKDIESLDKDIVDLLKDHAKDIKMNGEGEKAKPGGMDGLLFKGTAKDKQDGSAIEIFALLLSPEPGKVAIIFIEAAADTPDSEAEKLTKILQSIKPGKSE